MVTDINPQELIARLDVDLEVLHEHIGACWSALREMGRDVGVAGARPRFLLGTPEYHLDAVEQAAGRLFQNAARLHPEIGES